MTGNVVFLLRHQDEADTSMRHVIAAAGARNDQRGGDPTVNRLQDRTGMLHAAFIIEEV